MLRRKKLLKAKKLARKKLQKKKVKPVIKPSPKMTGGEAWSELGLHDDLVRGLVTLGFTTPTEIQKGAIPPAMKEKRDIIGAAETGSGKTLAFGLPVLNHILAHRQKTAMIVKKRKFKHLPARDEGTAPEVIDLNRVIRNSKEIRNETKEWSGNESEEGSQSGNESEEEFQSGNESEEGSQSEDEFEPSTKKLKSGGELVYCDDNIPDDIFEAMLNGTHSLHSSAADTGSDKMVTTKKGASDSRGLIALILTPTRELALQVMEHIKAAAQYTDIKVCTIVGGMSSEKQERILKLRPEIVIGTPGRLWKMMKEEENPHLNEFGRLKFLILDEADRMIEQGHFRELSLILERLSLERTSTSYQTMVFSATLTLPRRRSNSKKKFVHKISGEESIESLISKAGLSETAAVIDLTSSQGTVDRLTESKIICTQDDKDLYLYYSLLTYTGRVLIFTNSLDCLHRLKSLLETLKLRPFPLHARMQQRQRLKNLDRFIADPNGLLLASDVAARGLDIPQVEHIIHYQVPKSTEIYVHRSGRTARGRAEGSSLMLVGPDDLKCYRNICQSLNRENDLPNFPIDLSILKPLRARVKLARKIDIEEHRLRKATHSQNWLTKTAEAMDIILDDELAQETEMKVKESKSHKSLLQSYKVELEQLLAQKLISHHLSLSFPSIQQVTDDKSKVTNKLLK